MRPISSARTALLSAAFCRQKSTCKIARQCLVMPCSDLLRKKQMNLSKMTTTICICTPLRNGMLLITPGRSCRPAVNAHQGTGGLLLPGLAGGDDFSNRGCVSFQRRVRQQQQLLMTLHKQHTMLWR